jgi:hypothetical protein
MMDILRTVGFTVAGITCVAAFIAALNWVFTPSLPPEPKLEREVVRVCDPGFMKMRGDRVEKDEEGRLWYVDRRGKRTLTNMAVLDEVCRAPKTWFDRFKS